MPRTRSWLTVLLALSAFGVARVARQAAAALAPSERIAEPYSPSPAAAPFVSLGYRELAADVQWVRLLGYFGSDTSTANGIAGVVDSLVALDPRFRRAYEYGARAITMASEGLDNSAYERALAVLDRGIHEFPDDWRMPELAGQIYTQDLVTKDPAQRRAWDEKGTLLVEAAVRKPGAPATEATWVATMRTRLGQHDRAVRDLREMILITPEADARKRLLAKLAALEDADQSELASEILETRKRFETAWARDRPALPPTMYVLLGAHDPGYFDLGDLATGGRDLVVSEDSGEREMAP